MNTTQKLRLAIVGPYPINPSKVTGGIQAVVKNLVNGLKHFEDLEIHIVTVDFDRQEQLVSQPGITIHVKQAVQGISQLAFYYQERQWLIRTIERICPDIVHVHGTNFYGYAAQNWSFPTVFTIHGILQKEGRLDYTEVGIFHQIYRKIKGYFNISFEVKTLKHIHHVIVISPYVSEMLNNFPIPKHYCISNPVDEAYFQLEDYSQPYRILFAGTINVRKGILTLIKSIELVRQVYPDVELHLAGNVLEPEYEKLLHSYVENNKLEKQIIFRGHLHDEELYQAFAECQMLVLPSQEEVSPMVVQQAMAAGKPVVATAVGGVPYIVEEGSSGLLVPFGDPQALSQAILRLLANPHQAKLLGARGREIASDRFRIASICSQTRAVYYELVNS
ncbi:glycosyltransferase family 4 protein [Anabaena azotica]|uniref:Glycosyltransferase family 4 protein n=1 Tax=Anabaena azotica FACHB-119 TaxID=947527 RepID=A0ABR8D8U4_9NOST|nr:glycosyltransferase family 4 protein [Anabaena azotica]MBD2502700.1 glycosyltransferase family 4 protein [Anabaena azotica FACHB-119]